MTDDWHKAWRNHLHSLATLQRLTEKLKAYDFHNWPRVYPNPPEMNELERDIFFRYVGEVLRGERSNRSP